MCVKGQTWSLLICKIHWKFFRALHVWHVLQVSSEACTIPLTNTCHPCKSSRSCEMIKVSVLSQRFFEKLGHRIQHPAWRENSRALLYFQAVGLNSLFNLCSKSLICCLSAMEGQWYCNCLNFWYFRFLIWGLPIKKHRSIRLMASSGKGSKAKHLLVMSLKVEISYWSKKVRSNTENQGCLMLI